MSWKHFFTIVAQVGISLVVLAVCLLVLLAVLSVAYNNFKEDK